MRRRAVLFALALLLVSAATDRVVMPPPPEPPLSAVEQLHARLAAIQAGAAPPAPDAVACTMPVWARGGKARDGRGELLPVDDHAVYLPSAAGTAVVTVDERAELTYEVVDGACALFRGVELVAATHTTRCPLRLAVGGVVSLLDDTLSGPDAMSPAMEALLLLELSGHRLEAEKHRLKHIQRFSLSVSVEEDVLVVQGPASGEAELLVELPGEVPRVLPVSWSRGQCAPLSALEAVPLTGRVGPLLDAPWAIVSACGQVTRTDARGRFSLLVEPGSCALSAWRMDGLLRATSPEQARTLAPGRPASVSLGLPPSRLGGIGASVRGEWVTAVVEGSPAAAAGLAVGMRLLTADGAPLDSDDLVGPEGSRVALTAVDGEARVDLRLPREYLPVVLEGDKPLRR